MSKELIAVIGLVLTCIIGVWKYFSRKAKYRREQADKAKKDMENAKVNNSPSDFLDSFNRLRK